MSSARTRRFEKELKVADTLRSRFNRMYKLSCTLSYHTLTLNMKAGEAIQITKLLLDSDTGWTVYEIDYPGYHKRVEGLDEVAEIIVSVAIQRGIY